MNGVLGPEVPRAGQLTTLEASELVAAEITRQDDAYGRFRSSDTGQVRLAVACLEDETREVRDAWRAEKGPPARWEQLRREAVQAAATAARLARDVAVEPR